MSNIPDNQKKYLSQAIQLEEAMNPTLLRSTMLVISISILGFVLWAAATNINEVARAPGEVIPEGNIKTVQHLEGGIVKQLNVRDGQVVQKGDVLVVLDGAGTAQDLMRAEKAGLILKIEEERLRAFLQGRDPDWTQFKNSDPAIIYDAENHFNSMRGARLEKNKLASQQLKEQKQIRSGLYGTLKTARENAAISQEIFDRRQKLNADGYVSDMQMMQSKRDLQIQNGEIFRLKNEIEIADKKIREFEIRMNSTAADQIDDVNQRLSIVMAEQSQNEELIQKLQNRNERLVVRSPSSGVIKGLEVNTIGEVVRPGAPLMDILPTQEKLIAEVRIKPQYIGHITTGQQVRLKFSSFDFSRYGSVNGILKQISATTFSTDDGERYYEGLVSLDRQYVGEDMKNIIVPGMTVMADVITGEKTIMDYLLKPIQRSVQTAFSER